MAARGRHNADVSLAFAVARGLTVEGAASAAGVSPRTAYRRLANPSFRVEVAEAQIRVVEKAVGVLADGTVEAAQVLRELAREGPPAVRLGAARALLQLYVRLRDEHEFAERLAVVEAALKEESGHAP
jgi:hypothetical protein